MFFCHDRHEADVEVFGGVLELVRDVGRHLPSQVLVWNVAANFLRRPSNEVSRVVSLG